MGKPLVSIIIPVYNMEKYIQQCLESVKRQTFSDFEVIIVNDGSVDQSETVIHQYLEDKRFNYYYQKNKGLPSTLNNAIERSSGTYLTQLDPDDSWRPERLQRMVDYLEANPDIAIAVSDTYIVVDDVVCSKTRYSGDRLPSNISFMTLLKENQISGFVLFRRDVVKEIGLFDESIRCAEDYEYWLRAAKSGLKFGILNEPLSYYRWHPGGLSSNIIKMHQYILKTYKKVLQWDLTQDERAVCNESIKKERSILGYERVKKALHDSNRLMIIFEAARYFYYVPSDHTKELFKESVRSLEQLKSKFKVWEAGEIQFRKEYLGT